MTNHDLENKKKGGSFHTWNTLDDMCRSNKCQQRTQKESLKEVSSLSGRKQWQTSGRTWRATAGFA